MKLIRELLENGPGSKYGPGSRSSSRYELYVDDFDIDGPDEDGFYTAEVSDYSRLGAPEKNALKGVVLRAIGALLTNHESVVDVVTLNDKPITSVREFAYDADIGRGFAIKAKSMFASMYQGDDPKMKKRLNRKPTDKEITKMHRLLDMVLWDACQ